MHFFIFAFALYFVPAIVAALRHTHNATAILLDEHLPWLDRDWLVRGAPDGDLLGPQLRLLLPSRMVRTGAGSHEPRWTMRDWLARCRALSRHCGRGPLAKRARSGALRSQLHPRHRNPHRPGQVPYRDFPLAHAPLTFLIQAAIIRLTGRVFFHHALYTASWAAWARCSLAHRARTRCAGAWRRHGRSHCSSPAAHGAGHLLHRAQSRVRLRLRLLDTGSHLHAAAA